MANEAKHLTRRGLLPAHSDRQRQASELAYAMHDEGFIAELEARGMTVSQIEQMYDRASEIALGERA